MFEKLILFLRLPHSQIGGHSQIVKLILHIPCHINAIFTWKILKFIFKYSNLTHIGGVVRTSSDCSKKFLKITIATTEFCNFCHLH